MRWKSPCQNTFGGARSIPRPSKGSSSKGTRLVVLPALSEVKLQLNKAMRFDRLLDLTYASQLDQIEEALKALDR